MSSGKTISPQQVKLLDEMLARPENRNCADCGARGPRWASTNLGVFVCIRCSGIHRAMGTHISKVRSVNLDTWTPDQLAEFAKWGNARANELYEYNLPPNFSRPLENDNYGAEQFIRQKYERKVWMKPADPRGAAAANQQPARQQAPAAQQYAQQPPQQYQQPPQRAPQPVAAPQQRVTPQPYAAPPGAAPIDFASFQSAGASSFAAPAPAPAAAAAPSFDLFGAPAPAPAAAPPAPAANPAAADPFAAFASSPAPAPQASSQLDKNSIMNMYKQAPPAGAAMHAPSGPNYNVHLNQPQPQQMYIMTANGPQLVYVQQQPMMMMQQPVAQPPPQQQFRF